MRKQTDGGEVTKLKLSILFYIMHLKQIDILEKRTSSWEKQNKLIILL